jgi:ABC-2 type transport system permease protein
MATFSTPVPASIQLSPGTRSGPTYWWSSYRIMLRWELASLRRFLPLIVVIQILAGMGFVLGFGLFFPRHVAPAATLYLATGVPVINLYLLGLVFGPQVVAQQKVAQTYDYLQSLSTPRAISALAWYSVTLFAGIPGVIASLLVSTLRYHISFSVSPAIIPATLLVSFTSTMMGYGLAHAIPRPMVTQVLTQAMNFFALGFSPICFPPDRLPGWLATVNRGLPFEHMGDVMRSGLTPELVTDAWKSYAILVVWACVSSALAVWAVRRRR